MSLGAASAETCVLCLSTLIPAAWKVHVKAMVLATTFVYEMTLRIEAICLDSRTQK